MNKIFTFLAFIIPIGIILTAFFLLRIVPFGSNTIWYIDLPYQIILFYDHLYDVLHGQGSLLFTWNYGMGTNFWPTFCYYLSSPLSLLIIFFPRELIPQAVIVIYLIKLGLASLAMSFMLKKLFGLTEIKNVIFSISYSLMSFSITYYFLPMWLDSIYLLPILIYSVHLIINKDRYKLFLVTLTLLFISNFYISYMTGIFVFLYFLTQIYLSNFTKKEVTKKFALFFKSVILAVCFSMFVLLPTYLQIKNNTYSGTAYQYKGFAINPLDIYQRFFIGTTEVQNLSIYTGLFALLLVPLYFLNKKYSLKERMTHLLLLSFMLFSIPSNFLNYVWHLFEVPNGAFYRFAFLISFYLIILSVKAYIALDRQMLPFLWKIYGFNIVVICLLNKLSDQNFFTLTELYLNVLILTALFCFLMIKAAKVQFKYKRVLNLILLCIVAFDLFCNSFFIFRNYTAASSPADWDEVYNPAYQNAINHILESDKGLYRVKPENELLSTENESLRYGYNGMSIYTSTGNGKLNEFLGSLGYAASSRAANMKNGIFVSDMLFGFHYTVSLHSKDERIYQKIFEDGKVKAYKNNYSLPIGFLINREQFSSLENQNNWMEKQNTMLGSYNGNSSYYKELHSVDYNLTNISYSADTKSFQKMDPKNPAFIEFKIKVDDLKELYLQLKDEEYQNYDQLYSLSIDGNEIQGAKLGFLNSLDLGTFENETVNAKFQLDQNAQSVSLPKFYTLDYTLVGKRTNEINQSAFHIQKFRNNFIAGNIDVEDNKVLFLSIPYDKGWKITVDGKQVESLKLGEFIGVPLKGGSHKVELHYSPNVLYGSLVFSTVILVCFLVYIFFFERKKRPPVTD
ncbi:YfhO family protein [Neobacillus muris]|uniref:YfhO family protein n=1 Tax=Neobacillus muris TaxID=2941334 RepID=UPI00203C691D|nr:YfhO family protein [Neobacillus muris]